MLLACITLANASSFTFSGVLDPALNSNLTYWDQIANSYASPITGPDDASRAYNIAVHTFSVVTAGSVTFDSVGYGMGGFDSVVSVFQGTGTSATYLFHSYAPSGPGDFTFDLNMGAGTYTLAIGMFANEPCAAGFCFLNGDFNDGFTNLVNFDSSRPDALYYKVNVSTGDQVPEPASSVLLLVGAAAGLFRKCFRNN